MAAQAGVVVQVLMRGRGGTTRARARSQGHWGEEDRRGNGVHPEGRDALRQCQDGGEGVQVAVVKSRNPEQRWLVIISIARSYHPCINSKFLQNISCSGTP